MMHTSNIPDIQLSIDLSMKEVENDGIPNLVLLNNQPMKIGNPIPTPNIPNIENILFRKGPNFILPP